MITIGDVKPRNKFFLAPLAGVNCAAFRIMCKEKGAGMVYSQMIDAQAMAGKIDVVGKQDYFDFLNVTEEERPSAVQFVGNKPEHIIKCAKLIEDKVDIIDINFGCCESDILGRKMGAYYSKHPELMTRLVKPIVKELSIPVTAKIRIGWTEQSINGVSQATILEEAGVSAITVHGRTKNKLYSGKANWTIVKQIKEKAGIPVIGNGDIDCLEAGRQRMKESGCDFVMIARAAIGNPSVFSDSKKTKDDFFRFLELYREFDTFKFGEVKTHAVWFASGLKYAKGIKQQLVKTQNIDEIIKIYEKI
ncbi:MAG: tRNA-dihydrouridine synthase family protein [Nanoarchaeota archaeon]|nr:tRNA-dihydrouridine synthase family protein [Nanoarchaeota archaeon]MBU1703949.1 tRNA-dihydrouridine synthase family protein [Nanoarchaeota archaeon]